MARVFQERGVTGGFTPIQGNILSEAGLTSSFLANNRTGLNLLKKFGYFAHAFILFRFNPLLFIRKRQVFFLPRK